MAYISKHEINNILCTGRKQISHIQKNKKKDTHAVSSQTDSVNISGESINFGLGIENLKGSVHTMFEVLDQKMNEVKKKLEVGFYDTKEVIERVADKIVESFGSKNQNV